VLPAATIPARFCGIGCARVRGYVLLRSVLRRCYKSNSSQTMLVVHVDESSSYFKIRTFSESGTRVIAEYNWPCENTGRRKSIPNF
jgi:hypothetical protein